MSALLEQEPKVEELVIRREQIKRVLICNAAGEPVGCVYVPDGGALVVEQTPGPG